MKFFWDWIFTGYQVAIFFGAKVLKAGRDERIWTSDPLVPNEVLYQAEPHPDAEDAIKYTNLI